MNEQSSFAAGVQSYLRELAQRKAQEVRDLLAAADLHENPRTVDESPEDENFYGLGGKDSYEGSVYDDEAPYGLCVDPPGEDDDEDWATDQEDGAYYLTFSEFSHANISRAGHWHPGFPEEDDWTGGDWACAMAGEAGEACNVVKKLRRLETGHVSWKKGGDGKRKKLVRQLAAELADTLHYIFLLAAKYDIDLEEATIRKFNEVSEAAGFPERIGPEYDE